MRRPRPPGAPNTVSLRLRVTAAVIIVLAVMLILLSVAVNAIFVAQSNRNLEALLTGRAQLARQLARTGVGAAADRQPGRGRRRTGLSGAAERACEFGSPPPTGAGIKSTTITLNAPAGWTAPS